MPIADELDVFGVLVDEARGRVNVSFVSGDLFREAASEIRRLRVELAEAYDACRYALADSPRWQENCATVVATWEARRG